MLTPREKSPLPENFSKEDQTVKVQVNCFLNLCIFLWLYTGLEEEPLPPGTEASAASGGTDGNKEAGEKTTPKKEGKVLLKEA